MAAVVGLVVVEAVAPSPKGPLLAVEEAAAEDLMRR
jgi:hypothetical protein